MFKKKYFVLLLVVMTLLFGINIYADEEKSASMDTSFYKMSSVASAYLSDVMSNKKDKTLPDLSSGNAGGLLGYSDEMDNEGVITGWVMSAISASSVTFSYDSLDPNNETTESGESGVSEDNQQALYEYAQYGRVLSLSGLDKTGTESAFNILRKITGTLMQFTYAAAMFTPKLFSGLVTIMKFLNPFQLFDFNRLNNMTIEGLEYAGNGTSAFSQLSLYVTNLYKQIQDNIVMVIFTFMFVFLITGIVLSNNKDLYNRVKKFFIRAVAMFLGLPLCAGLYTSLLDTVDDVNVGSMSLPSQIVLSTFVDFESWAQYRSLAAPDNTSNYSITADTETDNISDSTVLYLRQTCYEINKSAIEEYTSLRLASQGGTDGSVSGAITGWNSEVQGGGININNSTGAIINPNYGLSSGNISDLTGVVNNILDRYTEGRFYYASTYESYVKSKLAFDDDLKEEFENTGSTVATFKSKGVDYLSGEGELWSNGGNLVDRSSSIGNYMNFSKADGLSHMALYNYLTSSFGESSVIVYSAEKAASGYIRQSHYSVNLIGTGIMSVLYYFSALFSLGATVVVGLCYFFISLCNSFKRTILMIFQIPFLMLGSLRSMAKVLVHVLVMFLEIIVNILLYSVVSNFIFTLNDIVGSQILEIIQSAMR